MAITMEIPPVIENSLTEAWGEQAVIQKALEGLATEGYRSEILSQRQVGELLGLNFWETEAFLKSRQVWLHYDLSDLEQDRLGREQAEKRRQVP